MNKYKIYIKDIKGLNNESVINIPKKATKYSAGYDIIATTDPLIIGEKWSDSTSEGWKRIDYIEYGTNLYIEPDTTDIHTLIHPRSSISKYNLSLANSIGLCDNDYRGQILCRFNYLWQPEDFSIGKTMFSFSLIGNINDNKIYHQGDTIAQLVFGSTVQVEFELIEKIQSSDRGTGGFGSTNV